MKKISENAEISFYGGTGFVTGANFMFDYLDTKILIDCGMIQGIYDSFEKNSSDFLYDPSSVKYLFVTHAHLDHVGRIPKLVKDGFKGRIVSTPETKDLAKFILEDASGLIHREASEKKLEPYYNINDVSVCFERWDTLNYHESKTFGDIEVTFYDAGHILGSSMIDVKFYEKRILFTGDLGNSPSPLMRNTEKALGLDYILMESVYGDRNHESKDIRLSKLKEIILETSRRGGTLLIPAFSLERTQVLILDINNLVENNLIPEIPVFIDSPLATKITQVYKRSTHLFNDDVKKVIESGDDIFSFPKLKFTVNINDSNEIHEIKKSKIIIAGSGMSSGGRIINHEERFLSDPKNSLLLVGYQGLGTLGRLIEDGSKKIILNGREVRIRANIYKIEGYSSHKDSDSLVDFVSGSAETLKKVFVAMGEPKSAMFLAQRLKDELGVEAVCPEPNSKHSI